MKALLIIAWLGNLIDMIATVYLTSIGYTEINPIMAYLLVNPIVFIVVKIVVMTGVCTYLWLKRTSKYSKPLATFAATVYGAISIYYMLVFWAIV